MPEDNLASRKDRKAQRDSERRLNRKKRKISDVEAEEGAQDDADATKSNRTNGADEIIAELKVKAETRKQKRSAEEFAVPAGHTNADAASRPKKRKKTQAAAAEAGNEDAEVADAPTKSRFILFIGNLPYSTTDASLKAHFQKLEPFNLRHRTDPKTKKSKGFAFLEFENYDRMKTCLKLYHHSMFDPAAKENGGSGKGNGKGGRKINVELTSGGGGNTTQRKEKIKSKNERLEEQRKRRAEAEKKEKSRKAKKDGTDSKASGETTRAEEEVKSADAADGQGIHPSRLARIQH